MLCRGDFNVQNVEIWIIHPMTPETQMSMIYIPKSKQETREFVPFTNISPNIKFDLN